MPSAGRLKTLQQGDVSNVRLAVVTCSNFPAGYFNAYASIATQNLDLVLHVGDYIYEYKDGEFATKFADTVDATRKPAPNVDLITLSDYRLEPRISFLLSCSFGFRSWSMILFWVFLRCYEVQGVRRL